MRSTPSWFNITGMSGGTGTGAAPVVARISKEMGVLTVVIVTIPFEFEGRFKIIQALTGVEKIAKNVDALLVINNERLRDMYAEIGLSVPKAYEKADETLTIAAKSIAEIITIHGLQNLDFADVHTTMKDGGVALMSNGYGEGEDRLQKAIDEALKSPLLNNNDIFNARRILFNIYYSDEAELGMDEMNYVHEFMARFKTRFRVKWGFANDNSLGKQIKITILATGFGLDNIPEIADKRRIESEEEAREEEERAALRQQEEEKERDLLDRYGYGNLMSRPKVEVVVLNPDELDDDYLISLLEETPAYKRNMKEFAKARQKEDQLIAQKETSAFSLKEDTEPAYKKDKPDKQIISFK